MLKSIHLANRAFEKGIEIPLVTLGKDGAIALINNNFFKFTTPDVPIKNSVGSGDSTIAGIATGFCRGLDTLNAIKLGLAAGTSNTQFEETGVVSCKLAEKYYKEILIEKI